MGPYLRYLSQKSGPRQLHPQAGLHFLQKFDIAFQFNRFLDGSADGTVRYNGPVRNRLSWNSKRTLSLSLLFSDWGRLLATPASEFGNRKYSNFGAFTRTQVVGSICKIVSWNIFYLEWMRPEWLIKIPGEVRNFVMQNLRISLSFAIFFFFCMSSFNILHPFHELGFVIWSSLLSSFHFWWSKKVAR